LSQQTSFERKLSWRTDRVTAPTSPDHALFLFDALFLSDTLPRQVGSETTHPKATTMNPIAEPSYTGKIPAASKTGPKEELCKSSAIDTRLRNLPKAGITSLPPEHFVSSLLGASRIMMQDTTKQLEMMQSIGGTVGERRLQSTTLLLITGLGKAEVGGAGKRVFKARARGEP
jgi:hypothetical protein